MIVKKFLITLVLSMIYSYSVFAEHPKQEGIFIEAISELIKGNLTIDEVRTRPTEISSTSKKSPLRQMATTSLKKF